MNQAELDVLPLEWVDRETGYRCKIRELTGMDRVGLCIELGRETDRHAVTVTRRGYVFTPKGVVSSDFRYGEHRIDIDGSLELVISAMQEACAMLAK